MKDDLHGSLFQTLEATDENDLDCAIPVFRLRHIVPMKKKMKKNDISLKFARSDFGKPGFFQQG